MLLTYSNIRFPSLIKNGIKIHTIRIDAGNRWKPGMKIDHWMHNPRNVSKNPYPFMPGVHRLISKQEIEISKELNMVQVDGRFLTDKEIEELAYNDGLTNRKVFFKWLRNLLVDIYCIGLIKNINYEITTDFFSKRSLHK